MTKLLIARPAPPEVHEALESFDVTYREDSAPLSEDEMQDALRDYDGVVEQASESELLEACAEADRTGLFNCPHTGVALAAMKKLITRGLIQKSDRVVVISTAHGLKFVDFKVDYHRMELEGLVSENPNPIIELPAEYEKVRSRMLEEIDRRFSG